MSESQVERQLLFDALVTATSSTFRMAELGAGRGDWTLAAAGSIDNLEFSPPLSVTQFQGLAIEAEPQHYEWTRRHLEEQSISAWSVQLAISSRKGKLRFNSSADPADNYGQSLSSSGNLVVKTSTLDDVVPSYFDGPLDLIHMDIQGEELRAVLGGKELFRVRPPKALIIGTHAAWLNWALKSLLGLTYDCPLNVKPKSRTAKTPFGPAYFPADGLMYFTLKSKTNRASSAIQTALMRGLLVADSLLVTVRRALLSGLKFLGRGVR